MGMQSPGPIKQWRLSIGTLLFVGLGLVLTAAATLGFVLWSAAAVDRRALDQQAALARHVIQSQLARVPHEQESITIWDDSIVNTSIAFNEEWINVNIGRWMLDYFGHDDVLIVNQANQPIYAMAEGSAMGDARRDAALAQIMPLISQMRVQIAGGGLDAYNAGSVAHPPRVSELAVIDGTPALVSISPIISDSGTLTQPTGSEYLHVSMVRLDDDYASRLGEEYQIPALSFSFAGSAVPGIAEIPLTDIDGRFIAFLEWQQSRPGQALLDQAIPAIAGAFLIAALIMLVLMRQLWRNSSALEAGRADAEFQAAHDHLTGLPNRLRFESALTQVLMQRPDRDRRISILVMDLDRFKTVNDTLGHRAGDDLIRAVGQRLSQLLGPDEILARLGGDEFAIIHRHAPGLNGPFVLSNRIIDAIGKPFDIFGSEAFVGVSIGIATVESEEADAHELVRKADIALYEAKAGGRNRAIVFEETMNELLQNQKTIEVELREALRLKDQLSVAFQPLFAADGSIIGAEALARWTHPRLGQISPTHFVPVAEATGLIGALGSFVLRVACELGAKWPGYTFAVNISPAQLRDASFPSTVFDMLAQTGMRPVDLELEVTEGILLEEASEAAEALRIFRAADIKIALDDFGTGYSSLNYLKRYPVDRVKIDRSFVSQLAPGSVSIAIVQAMVTLAHALRIDVTAEGVETQEQMAVLRALGCNVYQGFLLSAPIPSAAFEKLLTEPESRVA
ncbi:MAG: EAL domain-containing protein [Devosia sp.]